MSFRYAALVLIVINIAVFAVQISAPGFTESFLLESADVAARPWILVTSMFLHGSLLHILGNMFALAVFGIVLENIIGTRRFLAAYFAGGIAASLVAVPFYASALGASGAIFAALGSLAAIRPRMIVWTYGVPLPMAAAAGFWLLIDLAGAFSPSSIANIAHIGGMLFGIAVSAVFLRQFREWKSQHKRRRALTDEQLNEWEEQWM